MDAGCGTGGVSRELIKSHKFKTLDALDFSRVRLDFALARLIEGKRKVSFIEADLNHTEKLERNYDLIISRFVMHHLINPAKVISNLANNLKKSGELVIIDSDGILFNFYCKDRWVLKILEEIRLKLNVDMYVARKLKVYMSDAGLKKLDSRIIPMHFKGEDLKFEKQQYAERFLAFSPWLECNLGLERSLEFQARYLASFDDDGTEIFYNKFITCGKR